MAIYLAAIRRHQLEVGLPDGALVDGPPQVAPVSLDRQVRHMGVWPSHGIQVSSHEDKDNILTRVTDFVDMTPSENTLFYLRTFGWRHYTTHVYTAIT